MAMYSGRRISFISYILTTIFVCLTNAQPRSNDEFQTPPFCKSGYEVNYTSVYLTNLDNLNSTISALPAARFYNFSIGRNPDTVYVIGLCRGDVAMDICGRCLTEANTKLRNLCPYEKRSIGWDYNCMLRYSDEPMFNIWQESPNAYTYNSTPVLNEFSSQFNQAVRTLLRDLLRVASRSTSVQKFATGTIPTGPDNNTTIYALAECTPDLSEQDCRDCLNRTHEILPTCCDGRIGGRVLFPSCNFRYEISPFFSIDTRGPPSVLPPPVQGNGNGENNTTDRNFAGNGTDRNLIVIVISTIVLLVLVIACIWIIMRKRKQKKRDIMNEGETSMEINIEESLRFDFDTIKVATDDFSDTNKLGQGGFGAVYKGRLPDGRDVAVKRLSQTSQQGEAEFKNEVLLMANLQHRNLVRLLGFCLHGKERLLIYEFIPNTSLDHFIFDPKKRGHLDGDMRYKIIVGIARGLLYLHEDSRVRIIHRDLKTSNILLDATMHPKIADFGMARIFDLDENENQASTQRIVGTYGYMAPEYAMFGQFSVKSDVFSFGVLVLEILSGQKNTQCFENEDSAWKNWQEGTHSKFIDPSLKDGSFSLSGIMRCIHIGLLCVQEKVVDRPTMASVVNMFNNVSLALQKPTEPAFFRIDPQRSQVMFKSEDSVNEASITELSGR